MLDHQGKVLADNKSLIQTEKMSKVSGTFCVGESGQLYDIV